jgi:hypothetical protein
LGINSSKLYQLFKYAVYTLLAINVFVFFREEWLAANVQFVDGVPLAKMIEAYAATIDTAAWVVLLLMFELETYVLEDHQYNPAVTWTLHGVRALCYTFIVYAFYGYIVNLAFINAAVPAAMTDLCNAVSGGWSYAVDLDEYTAITAANCATFSEAAMFMQLPGILAVVDAAGLTDIRYLAWVDVINSAVWLLVVLVLEVDVRLQERGYFEGWALRTSNVIKFFLYGALLLAAIYWGIKGDFVDFWDAFLWLVAFVFIELNVVEWREEVKQAAVTEPQPT